ncbi:hypothetical protein L7F22_012432 [Adiantum nelumboides]|nr:hypothetical protein [Adiantum nelumboides]
MGSSSGEEEAWLRVMEVATLCILPMALKAAVELEVPNILAQHSGPSGMLSAAQIAQHLRPAHAAAAATSLDRILRLLASHGLLSSSSSFHTCPDSPSLTTSYGLNPSSLFLLQHGDPSQGSLSPFVLAVQHPIFIQSLIHLHHSVLYGGIPFTKAHGMPLFPYTQHDPSFNTLFNHAMAGHSKLVMEALLKTYQGFNDITSLVDVGGGNGACLSMIVAQHPSIKGINFDQHHVIATAPHYPGVDHVEGDMFKEIPHADAIFMKWILHDWSDSHCLRILENCNKALPKEGKVIVVDAILPTQVEHDLNARVQYHMDLLMFSYTDGGKERTKEELEILAKASGFCNMQIICNLHGLSVIELHKEIM